MNDTQSVTKLAPQAPEAISREVPSGIPAQARMLRGAFRLADAVRAELGPHSRAVLIQRRRGAPIACSDGVAIARELEFQDPDERLGAWIMRQAAERTSKQVGDGTSTAIVLAHAILTDGLRDVCAGSSAIEIGQGLERARRAVVGALQALSRPVGSLREKLQIATLAVHGAPGVAELVVGAMERVGHGGAIRVEESTTAETTLELFEGMQFEGGYLKPYFVTNPARMEAELKDALVLLAGQRIQALKDVRPLLDQVAQARRPLLVVAEDVEDAALATLIVDLLRGRLRCCAVRAPGHGDHRRAMLQDLAALTGGTVIGGELASAGLPQLGHAKRVVVSRENTTIIGGGGCPAIEARIQEIRREIEQVAGEEERATRRGRLARLSGGVAVIHVGAPTEAERHARTQCLDKAITVTRAALDEGLVPGGGVALLRCVEAVAAEEQTCAGDERTGVQILKRALEAPMRQIAENAAGAGEAVPARPGADVGQQGFDAVQHAGVDLAEAGIIDATKVVRVALENAVSLASMLLLMQATPTELPEREVDASRGELVMAE